MSRFESALLRWERSSWRAYLLRNQLATPAWMVAATLLVFETFGLHPLFWPSPYRTRLADRCVDAIFLWFLLSIPLLLLTSDRPRRLTLSRAGAIGMPILLGAVHSAVVYQSDPYKSLRWSTVGASPYLELFVQFGPGLIMGTVLALNLLMVHFLPMPMRTRPGMCTCGYDLTGNLSGVCPECGQPISHIGSPQRDLLGDLKVCRWGIVLGLVILIAPFLVGSRARPAGLELNAVLGAFLFQAAASVLGLRVWRALPEGASHRFRWFVGLHLLIATLLAAMIGVSAHWVLRAYGGVALD